MPPENQWLKDLFPIELVPFYRGHLFVLGAATRKNGSGLGILFGSWCERKGAKELEVSKSLNRERFGATPFPSTDYYSDISPLHMDITW